jgi:HEAT repeat protein
MQFVDAAQQARRNYPTDRAPLVVIPVLSRWDGDREVDIAEQWMARLDQELRPLTDAWLPRHFSPRQYLEKARVRHVARFSFGEPLPVLTHSLTDPTLPCVAYEILARMIDSNCADAGDVVDETYSVKESTLRNIISSDDELELKRFRAHFERSNRRTRFVWAMSLALLMITFGGSYVWDFCTFTAVVAETLHENQRTEIVVTRKWDPRTQSNRFRLGTFVFRDEMRNQDAIIKFHQGVKLNVGFQPDWTALVPLLNDSRLGLAEIEWLSRPITSPRSFIKEDEDAVFQFNDRWKWGRADSKVIDALVMLLKDQESDVRGFATDSLWRLGKSDPEKIASLLTLLKDQNRGVRSRAAESLGKLGKGDPSVIVPLVTLLNDSDGVVRSSAAKSLGQLGNSNPVVIDSLVTLFIDSDSVVRSSAAKSLGQLGDSAPAVIDALVTLLKDLDSDVRYRAVESLGQLRKSDAKVIAALVTLLEDQNNDDYISYNAKGQPTTVRSRAAMSLGQLGKSDPVVIDALVTLLKDQNVFIRSNAAESLGQLGMSTPSVIDALVPLLEDPDRDVRFSAAASLVQLGKSDSPVIAALLPVLNDPSFYYDETRARAEATLVQLGKNDRMVSDVFVRLLNDPNRAVRSLAAASLVQMGKSAPALIEILVALLEDQESNIRSRAAASLGQLEKSAPAVIVALTTLLKDQDRYVSRSAAKSLGQIAKTRDDWTDLRMLAELSNFDSGIRERAGIVLAYRHDEQGHELNPQTRQAIEQLRKDPRPWVRQASLHALYHIENRKAELAELARNNGVTANTTPK